MFLRNYGGSNPIRPMTEALLPVGGCTGEIIQPNGRSADFFWVRLSRLVSTLGPNPSGAGLRLLLVKDSAGSHRSSRMWTRMVPVDISSLNRATGDGLAEHRADIDQDAPRVSLFPRDQLREPAGHLGAARGYHLRTTGGAGRAPSSDISVGARMILSGVRLSFRPILAGTFGLREGRGRKGTV